MAMNYESLQAFWDYIEMYPDEDEPGFDGIHYGGIKGLLGDAPDAVKKAYSEYLAQIKEANKNGIKL